MEGEQEKSARAALARERRKAYQAREAKEMAIQRRIFGSWIQMLAATGVWFGAAGSLLVQPPSEYVNAIVGMIVSLWFFGAGLINYGKVDS